VDRITRNIVRLWINTIVAGHTSQDSRELSEDLGLPDDNGETLATYLCDRDGSWRISDYALDSLIPLCVDLLKEEDPMQKLVLVDRVLNVTHARSDLAESFVEGGDRTLDKLSAI
jgi:hypothetical protein